MPTLFSSPTQSVPALPALPDRSAEELQARKKETAQAVRRRAGRGSTRLSGGLGDTSAPNLDKPALTRLGN